MCLLMEGAMQAVMEQRRKMAEWHKSNAPPPRPGGGGGVGGGAALQGAAGVPAGRMTENKVVSFASIVGLFCLYSRSLLPL